MAKILTIVLAILFLASPVMAQEVALNWTLPQYNCDGSNLTDLAGTYILWGDTMGGPYPYLVNIADPTATTVVVDVGPQEMTDLYFVAVSYDILGNRSDDAGGCGTSGEFSVPFGPILPAPPTGLGGAVQ